MCGTQDKRNHRVMFAKRKSYYFVSVSLSIISITYLFFSFFLFLIVCLSRYALIAFTLLSVGVSWVFCWNHWFVGKMGEWCTAFHYTFSFFFTFFYFLFFYFTRVINWAMNKVVVSVGYSVMA